MIHVFHGFLGSPEDFSFLKRDDVLLHDLYQEQEFEIKPEDTLIGYSMGGRIALDLAKKHNYNFKKLVLINAHPGLTTDEEKAGRAQWELNVLNSLKSMEQEDFLEMWNSLPLFMHDAPLTAMPEERYKKSLELFARYQLSDQIDHLPDIVKYKDKILYIVGVLDARYMEIVTDYFLPYEVPVKAIPGGHRLFQEKDLLKKLLLEENIL